MTECQSLIRGGGCKANFLHSVIFRIFQYYHNTCYLLNITFISDRCHRSSAAVAPVKYKCDSNNLIGGFGISKILLTEKLTNGALVTPTPVPMVHDIKAHYTVHIWNWLPACFLMWIINCRESKQGMYQQSSTQTSRIGFTSAMIYVTGRD